MIDKEWMNSGFSKSHTLEIARRATSEKGGIQFLVELLSGTDLQLSRRAAWALDCIWQEKPAAVHPFLRQIADIIPNAKHTGLIRHAFKILAGSPLPKKSEGYIIDQAFAKLADPQMPVAVKIHAMHLLYLAALKEPGLQNELVLLIEEQYPAGTPGFKSRSKKILKKFKTDVNTIGEGNYSF